MQNIPNTIRNFLAIGLISLAASVTGCAYLEDDDDNDEPNARIQQDKLGDEDVDNAAN